MPITNQWEKRVQVFHYIYETLMLGNNSSKEIIKKAFEQYSFDSDQMKIIEYFANNKQEIIRIISAKLAKNWSWDRISIVDQAIMIEAYSEAKSSNIDKKVIIDQALITANKYGESSDKKFINAILDKII